MSDDRADMTAFQLADSFLPVGSYSASYALEQFVQTERVTDGEDLHALLAAYLHNQVGPADLVALRAAHAAACDDDLDELVRVDRRLHAVTLPAEFRESATRAGDRLCDLWLATHEDAFLSNYVDRDPPHHYPVVLGAVTARDEITVRRACLVHCHAFCSAMLGAAQRLCSLGHTRAQQILVDLQPVVSVAVERSGQASVETMTPYAPLVDVMAASHERAERRLFVS